MNITFRRTTCLPVIVLLLCCAVSAQTSAPSPARNKDEQRKLDSLVHDRECPELEQQLSHAQLSALDRDYFQGVLANRKNDLAESIRLLEKALPSLRTENKQRASIALRTLADDYVKTFQYAQADRSYSELLKDFGKTFRGTERKSMQDDAATNRLLKDAPPQQVELDGGFTLPTHRSPIGTIDTDLVVNGVSKSWILDTGANFSVLTETAANQMGLKLSEGTAQTQGATGAENPLHVALIPEMKIGTAVVRNAVVLVLKDSAISIPMPKGSYQIEAILGFPVLNALGQLTFSSDNHLHVEKGGDSSGAVMYMQQLDPLLQVRIFGREVLMFFDTGASSTEFSSRYYSAFRDHFTSQAKIRHGMGGAGGIKSFSAYQEPKVEIGIGNQTATLKDVPVLLDSRGTDHDLLYGNLGRDVTQEFKSFTLDFKAMRFRLEK